jgi:hypothetical protein
MVLLRSDFVKFGQKNEGLAGDFETEILTFVMTAH